MNDHSLLNLTERALAEIVIGALAHFHDLSWLSTSPLAASSLIAAAAPHALAAAPVHRGRALQAVLQWAVDALAPAPPGHPLGTPRPAADPTWTRPSWRRYNVLRHLYLDRIEGDRSDDGSSTVPALLRQMGLANRRQVYSIRSLAARQVGRHLRDGMLGRIPLSGITAAALAGFFPPFSQPQSQTMLQIAALFRVPVPRELLLAIARADGVDQPEKALDTLAEQQLVQRSAEGRALFVPEQLRPHIARHTAPESARRWHSRALDLHHGWLPPLEVIWHRYHAAHYGAVLAAVRERLEQADSGQCLQLRELLQQIPAGQLAPPARAVLAALRNIADIALDSPDLLLMPSACPSAADPAGEPDAIACFQLAVHHAGEDFALARQLFSQAAGLLPRGDPQWQMVKLHQASLLNDMLLPARAAAVLNSVLNAGLCPAPRFAGLAQIVLARALLLQNAGGDALTAAREAVVHSEFDGHLPLRARCHETLSAALLASGRPDQALIAAKRAAGFGRRSGYPQVLAAVLRAEALALLALNRPREALPLLEEALAGCAGQRHRHSRCALHTALADVHDVLGQLDAVRFHRLRARDLARQLNAPLVQARLAQLAGELGVDGQPLAEDGPSRVEQIALGLARQTGQMTAADLAADAGISTSTAHRLLHRLVANGLLARQQHSRGAVFVPAGGTAGSCPAPRSADSGAEQRLLSLLQRTGRLTLADALVECGSSRASAQRALARLVQRGLVRREGKGRATVYLPPAAPPLTTAVEIEDLRDPPGGEQDQERAQNHE